MVVTMPARRRDLRSWRYLSQLRLLTLCDDGAAEEAEAGVDALNGPLLLLLVVEVVERARALRASLGWPRARRDDEAPKEAPTCLAADADMVSRLLKR